MPHPAEGSPLELHTDASRTPARLVVRGEIDASNSHRFGERLAAAAGEHGGVALDLGGVEFLESSGLRALLRARQEAADAGHPVHVVAASAPVRRLFEIMGLGSLISANA